MVEQDAIQFILSQTKANIEFLVNSKTLSKDQGNDILAKLSSPPPINTATKPCSYLFKARAIWGYNENGQASSDLTFFAGDVIEVIEETNERIDAPVPERKPATFNGGFPDHRPPPQHNNALPYGGGPGYAPYHHPPQNYGPPPPNHYQPQYNAPPPPPAQQQVVVNSEPEKKPGVFSGGLGNTLAHSAAGGLGFGAGSAVAGNLVNSLF
ncbi:hypothetical protein CVT24_008780 [Panaeolus cyanescens]|uniref:SH3 domain-containing protein n=1 Tax=Panaeolus cyanescens TaxID=181874 RepID=A0A409VEC9_9AGAR|nr:hypothetical protein CVT24_008780 [Panaeolus cyanescens]